MRIRQDFIRGNPRIQIISGEGTPTLVPSTWQPVLGDTDVLVAIPDMHMYHYDSNLDNFRYGAESMFDLLLHLESLRYDLAMSGRRMVVAQLGDLFELRFPSLKSGHNVTVGEIRGSHPLYDAILRSLWSLDPILIYGNHDIEHRRHNAYHFSARLGSVYMEHGFGADRWYHFANPDRPGFEMAMFFFKSLRRFENTLTGFGVSAGYLRKEQHAAAGVRSGEVERVDFHTFDNYQQRQHHHFSQVFRGFEAGSRPRILIGAHSHRPFIDPGFAGGSGIYIDAGAFTDGRSDFVVVTNEEVAVCRYRRSMAAARVGTLRESAGLPASAESAAAVACEAIW